MGDTSTSDMVTQLILAYIYGKVKGGSGDTPNQYAQIIPPELKQILDEQWKVYKQGGTPQQQEVRSAGTQFLSGMPTTAPNFNFVSGELKGQKFAGGVTLPKIDVSKFATGAPPPTGTLPPPTPRKDFEKIPGGGGAGTFGVFGKRNQDINTGGQPGDDESIANWMGRNPSKTGYDANDILGRGANINDPINRTPTTDPATLASIKSAFDKFIAEHPNWKDLGPPALMGFLQAGLPGLAIGVIKAGVREIFRGMFGGGGTATPPPTPGSGGDAGKAPPPTPTPAPPPSAIPKAVGFTPTITPMSQPNRFDQFVASRRPMGGRYA